MLKLACPSCGANLELPEQLDVAHCMYCGGKIILRSENVLNEMVNVKRFTELAQVALEAKNYQEAIGYSNKILEIETQNVDAWLIKAEATFWLTTGANDMYEVAVEYLARASKINDSDPRIAETRKKIDKCYSVWLNSLGLDALECARKTYHIYDDGNADGIMETISDKLEARVESTSDYVKAMGLFIKASIYDPYNMTFLENLKIVHDETSSWISDFPGMDKKLRTLNALKAKAAAEKKIPQIEHFLTEARTRLKLVEGKKGFFDKMSQNGLNSRISSLERELKQNQTLAAFQPQP